MGWDRMQGSSVKVLLIYYLKIMSYIYNHIIHSYVHMYNTYLQWIFFFFFFFKKSKTFIIPINYHRDSFLVRIYHTYIHTYIRMLYD